jgi:hypothetical protein
VRLTTTDLGKLMLRAAVGSPMVYAGVKHARSQAGTSRWLKSIGFRQPDLNAKLMAKAAAGEKSPSAARKYWDVIDFFAAPRLGSLPLREVTAQVLDRWRSLSGSWCQKRNGALVQRNRRRQRECRSARLASRADELRTLREARRGPARYEPR